MTHWNHASIRYSKRCNASPQIVPIHCLLAFLQKRLTDNATPAQSSLGFSPRPTPKALLSRSLPPIPRTMLRNHSRLHLVITTKLMAAELGTARDFLARIELSDVNLPLSVNPILHRMCSSTSLILLHLSLCPQGTHYSLLLIAFLVLIL